MKTYEDEMRDGAIRAKEVKALLKQKGLDIQLSVPLMEEPIRSIYDNVFNGCDIVGDIGYDGVVGVYGLIVIRDIAEFGTRCNETGKEVSVEMLADRIYDRLVKIEEK